MTEPSLDDLVERLADLVELQTQILTRLTDIVAPKVRRTVQVCADELRTGDRIVSDRDPDIVNTVAVRPQWITKHASVQLIFTTPTFELIDRVADADECFTVLEPRPAPIFADDPFGTPNTLAVSPTFTGSLGWRKTALKSYGIDACDGGSLPQEARR